MVKIVKDVYACSIPLSEIPEGCYLQDDCSCNYANGTTQTYRQWQETYVKAEKRSNSTGFVVILFLLLGLALAYWYYKGRIRIQKLG